MKKQFIIEIDFIDGSIDFSNPDNLTYSESLGMIEFAKFLIMKELLNESKE